MAKGFLPQILGLHPGLRKTAKPVTLKKERKKKKRTPTKNVEEENKRIASRAEGSAARSTLPKHLNVKLSKSTMPGTAILSKRR